MFWPTYYFSMPTHHAIIYFEDHYTVFLLFWFLMFILNFGTIALVCSVLGTLALPRAQVFFHFEGFLMEFSRFSFLSLSLRACWNVLKLSHSLPQGHLAGYVPPANPLLIFLQTMKTTKNSTKTKFSANRVGPKGRSKSTFISGSTLKINKTTSYCWKQILIKSSSKTVYSTF